MLPAFVTGAVVGHQGATSKQASRCLLARRSLFAGACAPRRVRSLPAPRKTVRAAAAAPVEVTADSFESEVLLSEIPVLVDFYAGWCGPCKLVAPLMDWAASEFSGKLKVVKIDTELHQGFVSKYGIHGLPTFAVFKEGEAFGVQEGALGKNGLQEYILTHVPELKKQIQHFE